MTAGEGGLVLTNRLDCYEALQSIINCGRPSLTDTFERKVLGANYRITELQAAVSIKDDEYVPRLMLGLISAKAGRFDSALVHLRRAVELEPWASFPRLVLATTLDSDGDPGALQSYERFLSLAARDDPNLPGIRARLAALSRASRP